MRLSLGTKTWRLPECLLFAGLLCLQAATSFAQDARSVHAEIAQADREFFKAVFDTCDADAVGEMIVDDFEFFHDKWGQIANSKAEFVAAIRGACERQAAGTDFKARRELVAGSMAVFVMNNYGALQTGNHRFFKVEPGKADVPTEHARFTHLWRLQDGRWLLARVISYDHIDEAPSQQ
jgi:ketosteroid isomerase-like protein